MKKCEICNERDIEYRVAAHKAANGEIRLEDVTYIGGLKQVYLCEMCGWRAMNQDSVTHKVVVTLAKRLGEK